jgi:hypothetical protein
MTRPDVTSSSLRDLKDALASLQEEALIRDQKDREARETERKAREEQVAREQEETKRNLAKWVMKERFGFATIATGCSFAILLAVLPASPDKWLLYMCAFICVLAGAWQKDRANKHIANLLQKAGAEDVIGARTRW